MTYHFPDEIEKTMKVPKDKKGLPIPSENLPRNQRPKWKSVLDRVTLANINMFYDEKELNQ